MFEDSLISCNFEPNKVRFPVTSRVATFNKYKNYTLSRKIMKKNREEENREDSRFFGADS